MTYAPPPGPGQSSSDPAHSPWQPQPVARQRGRRRWPLVAGGGLALVIVIGAVVALTGGGLRGDQPEPGADPGDAEVSGDRSQWTAAVCAEDSDLATSSNFLYPDADNIAYCATQPSQAARSQSVVIGEWPREADIETDLSRLGSVHWFATATVGAVTTVFVLLDSPDRALLEPLSPFGFTITALD